MLFLFSFKFCLFLYSAFSMFIELSWHFSHWWHLLLIAKFMENLAVLIYDHMLARWENEDFRSSVTCQVSQLVNDATGTCALMSLLKISYTAPVFCSFLVYYNYLCITLFSFLCFLRGTGILDNFIQVFWTLLFLE